MIVIFNQLAETDDRNVLELLKIFAYGKYSDYRGEGPDAWHVLTKVRPEGKFT